jgi:predicted ATPase
VHNTEERWWEAELHRLRAKLLLRQAAERGTSQIASTPTLMGAEVEQPVFTEAEACFHRALDVARRQDAKSLELRATMSLSRLWQQQGRHAEARALLAPIYGWFTEGFDTADLQEAKALLEELS